MMKKAVLLLAALSAPLLSSAQSDMTVRFQEIKGTSDPFPLMSTSVIRSDTTVVAKEVPADLTAYRIRRVGLPGDGYTDEEKTALEERLRLYILIGDDKEGETVLIPDVNNNLVFTDDPRFDFPKFDESEQEGEYKVNNPFSSVDFLYAHFNGESFERRYEYLAVDPYKYPFRIGYPKDVDRFDRDHHLAVYHPEHRRAGVRIDDTVFNLYLGSRSGGTVYGYDAHLLIAPLGAPEPGWDEVPYGLGDVITVLDGVQYRIDSIAPWGESVTLKFLGYNPRPEGFQVGYYLPDMEAKTVEGAVFDWSARKGKYLLIDFWGTWCVPCIEALPDLKALAEKYKNANLETICVAAHEKDPEKVREFIAENGMDWTQLIQTEEDQDVITKLKISSYPTLMLTDPDGKILYRDRKAAEVDAMLSEISDR